MYGYIYLTTNLINGKKYLGKHKAERFDPTYKGSGKILLQAIEKDGWDQFECHILPSIEGVATQCETEEELNQAEEFYIDYYNCVLSEEYYNLKAGGQGGSVSGVRCLYKDGESKRVLLEEVDYWLAQGWIEKGPDQSPETIAKRAAKQVGRKQSKECIERRAAKLRGRSFSAEHRAKLSAAKPHKPFTPLQSVKCVETGEIFASITTAAQAVQRHTANICHAARKGKTCAGYHWQYV